MTLGKKESYANLPGVYYREKNQAPIPEQFELLDVEGYPYTPLTIETYRIR